MIGLISNDLPGNRQGEQAEVSIGHSIPTPGVICPRHGEGPNTE